MQLRPGDRLRCSNPLCGLEVIVVESPSDQERDRLLECWCGSPMKKRYVEPAVSRVDLYEPNSG